MKKHVRIASALLALTMMGQAYVPLCAHAAEVTPNTTVKNEGTATYNKAISAITISGIDEIKAGAVLPASVKVVADNGGTWEIPVVWADANGKPCTVASDENKAYPVFVFYMPDEYKLNGGLMDDIKVNLPDCVKKLFGTKKLVFIDDPANRLVYFTGIEGAGSKMEAKQATSVEDFVSKPSSTNNITKKADNIVVDLVAMHCDKIAIEKMGYDKLAALTKLVRYTIQPQAVNFLIDNFKCYSEAVEKGELGKDIGLYIYYDNALSPGWNKDRGEYEFSNPKYEDMKDAVAYVGMVPVSDGEHKYIDSETGKEEIEATYDGAAKYIVALNARGLDSALYQDEDGLWKLEDYKRAELNNTLTHEMMHGFMDDYTRPGMEGAYYNYDTNHLNYNKSKKMNFPGWFVEGTATCVENAYQYWNSEFKEYYGYDKTLDENGKEKGYSKDLLKEYYTNAENIMQLKDCNAEVNRRSSYCSGYLACLYLAKLISNTPEYRLKYGIKNRAMYEYIDNDGERYSVIDSEVLKQGLDILLREMHGGVNPEDETQWVCTSLEDIIRTVSPKDENGERIYDSIADFTNKFIAEDDKSAQFCRDVLDYMEYFSKPYEPVNGSVCAPFDSIEETLLKDEVTEGKAFVIKDTTETPGLNFVDSTVDPYRAYLPAGGINPWAEEQGQNVETQQTETQQTETEQTEVEPAA